MQKKEFPLEIYAQFNPPFQKLQTSDDIDMMNDGEVAIYILSRIKNKETKIELN